MSRLHGGKRQKSGAEGSQTAKSLIIGGKEASGRLPSRIIDRTKHRSRFQPSLACQMP